MIANGEREVKVFWGDFGIEMDLRMNSVSLSDLVSFESFTTRPSNVGSEKKVFCGDFCSKIVDLNVSLKSTDAAPGWNNVMSLVDVDKLVSISKNVSCD